MKSLLNKSLIFITLLFIVLSLSSCRKKEIVKEEYSKDTPYSLTFDAINNEFPISIFYSPFEPTYIINGNKLADYTSEYYIKLFKDAGVNIFSASPETYQTSRDSVIKVLETLEKYNMGYFVKDQYIDEMLLTGEINDYRIKDAIDRFKNYKSFIGFNLYDEPHIEKIKTIGLVSDAINRLSNNTLSSYVNLLPYYSNIKLNDGGEDVTWNEYIEEFLVNGNGKYVCYDHYVFDTNNYYMYFKNLDIAKKYCDAYKTPFWTFIQAGGQWNDSLLEIESVDYFPSEGEMLWNINTSIACGSKGIQYFMGVQPFYFSYAPNGTYDFNRNGLIGADGSINEWYYYAQKADKEILACSKYLLNSLNTGIIAKGSALNDVSGLEMVKDSDNFHELESVEGDTIISCLEYENQTCLFIVNYNMEKEGDVKLFFDGSHEFEAIVRGETKNYSGEALEIHLEAGEAVMLLVK